MFPTFNGILATFVWQPHFVPVEAETNLQAKPLTNKKEKHPKKTTDKRKKQRVDERAGGSIFYDDVYSHFNVDYYRGIENGRIENVSPFDKVQHNTIKCRWMDEQVDKKERQSILISIWKLNQRLFERNLILYGCFFS